MAAFTSFILRTKIIFYGRERFVIRSATVVHKGCLSYSRFIHIHPNQESSCELLSGTLHFWVAGKEHILRPGDQLIVPAGFPHCFWNEDAEPAHHIARFTPALEIADFFATFFALSRDGKLNKKGIPNLFHTAVIGLAFQNEIQLTKPPWPIQYLLYRLLAPIGKWLGYQAKYESKPK